MTRVASEGLRIFPGRAGQVEMGGSESLGFSLAGEFWGTQREGVQCYLPSAFHH